MLQLGNTAAGNHLVPAVAGNSWLLPPLCDACASAPATLFCKADSASLCEACDAEIHSANPLARRHHRAAIVPGVNYGVVADSGLNPVKIDVDSLSYGNEIDIDPTSFCGVVDQYLDLGDFDHQFNNINHYNNNNNNNNNNNIDRSGGCDDDSSNGGYNYSASLSHTVSFSKLDVGVGSFSKLDVGVGPEESTTMSENSSISHARPPRGGIGLLAGPLVEMPAQLSVMDREARVLRYREKKKARKFEKTIRYASRKAYAESRPRIKGRFARKGSVAEFEVDHLFSASLMADAGAAGFGIVPSFEV